MIDLDYAAAGLLEIERALAAGEWELARALAQFLDDKTGGVIGLERIRQANLSEVAA